MNQLVLNLSAGRARRDAGTQRTIDAEAQKWRSGAMLALALFAGKHRTFTAEQFRYSLLTSGCPEPHSHKVWGALFLSAARQGIIAATGEYRKASSPGTHAHPVAVWRAA